MDFLEFISVVVLFLVYLILFIKSIFKLKARRFSVAIPIVFIFIGFYVLPVFFDLYSGLPDYYNYPGLMYAQKYSVISVIYNFYISGIGVLLLLYINKRTYFLKTDDQVQLIKKITKYRWILWVMLVSPLFVLFFMSDPLEYFNYKAIIGADQDFKEGHLYMSRFCLLGILSSSVLFHFIKGSRMIALIPTYIFYILLTLLSIWIFGKRSIVAEYIILILTTGWFLGFYKGASLIKKSIIYLSILGLFIVGYGKGIYENDAEKTYTATRINFGRDHVVKFTLYKEFIDNKEPILEYRGQSFLFDLVFFVPRSMWESKPYPYAVYFTTSVFNLNKEPMGWGFTTSILEEFIANFGFIGFVLGPYLIILLCKTGDKSNNLIFKVLSVLITSLFLILHLPAFLVIFILYLFVLLRDKWRLKWRKKFQFY